MKELSASLNRTIEKLAILLDDAKANMAKIKAGQIVIGSSGRAALAETELADEVGYKSVVEVFNEVFARLLSGDVHEIQVRRYSEKQRQLKKLQLSCHKFIFLSDVAKVNEGLITYALNERKKLTKGTTITAESPSFDPGLYEVSNGRMNLSDSECHLKIDEKFEPVLVPEIREDGKILPGGHVLRVFFDDHWKLYECLVEKNGQLDGQALLFYPDGKIKSENFYSKGKLNGPSRFFGAEGQILAEGFYVHGLQQGKVHWYYPSGCIYSLQRYKNGAWHGTQEYYYENGVLKTLMHYDHGKLVGEVILQLPDGTLDRQEANEQEQKKEQKRKNKKK